MVNVHLLLFSHTNWTVFTRKLLLDLHIFLRQDFFSLEKTILWIENSHYLFLSAVWTLILTAPIHCRGSLVNEWCRATFLQIWWWSKLICILGWPGMSTCSFLAELFFQFKWWCVCLGGVQVPVWREFADIQREDVLKQHPRFHHEALYFRCGSFPAGDFWQYLWNNLVNYAAD